MSLSSSLFTGTSGLKNMGNALQVVGNNIANLNTIGFKRGRITFADTLYEAVATQAGADQMGRGMAVGSVSQNFDQGSFESTGNTTDLSIGGDGFFIMRQSNSENTFYTRAGNFFFDKAGQLVNPEGFIVQGWNLDDETGDDVGSITDLVLAEFTSPPKKSEEITAITNLDADANSKAVVLSNLWDSGETTHIDAGNYEYQTVIKAFDALGSTHDISIFYDKKSGTEWEYMVTMNPDEDNRNLVQNSDSKGLLARGTIKFSQSSGDILDLTMSKFTGRIGNFSANGVNTNDDVDYEIVDYDALAMDGYGFSLEFDGSSWNFTDVNNDGLITAVDLPTNYGNAKIVFSNDQNIYLTLTPDDAADVDPDLRIKFAQPAVATDSIGFDINNKNDLHIQGIEGLTYSGDTANDNTNLAINDPGVMIEDSSDLGIIWNPLTETWYWSNPLTANSAGTLVSSVSTNDSANVDTTSVTISNYEDLTMVSSGINVRYDARTTAWDWNMPLKIEDFANETFSFLPQNDPVLSIVTAGSQGAVASATTAGVATTITLAWDGSAWSASAGTGTTGLVITTGSSDNTQVQLQVWERNDIAGTSSGASAIRYAFGTTLTTAGSQTIAFNIDPTSPREYANAVLTTSGATTSGIGIDFDQDSTTDLLFNTTAGGGTIGEGDTLMFNTNPNIASSEYANATLKGDQNRAVIDLDGSGNETDKDDIVFSFDEALKFGPSTHPFNDRSVISFDIKGSTAWTETPKEDIKKTGYFEFTTDFLGGEFGTTETDIKLNIGTKYDGINFVNDSLSTTQYSKSSSTIFQDADGYAAGDLQGVDVASDGIMTGIYSNGQLIPLFRIGLAKFLNNFGLSNEGGNLFRETRASGGAITNKPGENGLGTLAPNSLELSNVDIAEEFVAMIVNQRGFQANSKTITTVDDMMQTVIQMKR
ncbi:MAG: flagellar hook-basal body complex protein [Desulfobacula sp.]|uniref:flagellar hook-basal body complex protein n=1 Tax=Desulfobacula sp. TaxID=2593537 RepID=UPI0025B9DC33|nr:flagellar hook-basal body complex protein [Desulfobacula sp.]MCD4722028.1 flagellar hook-basal body complex protein [Desulfobacula sp.]